MKEFISILNDKILKDRIDKEEIDKIDKIDKNTNKIIHQFVNNIEKEKALFK